MKALKILKGPIARSTTATSGIMGLRLILQAGTLVVLARTLGPEDFGTYVALGALAVVMGTFAGFGTHMRLLRDISRTPESRDESLQTTLGTTALCGTLLLGLYVLLCGVWLHAVDGMWIVVICLGIAELLLQPALRIASVERQARTDIVSAQLLLVLPLSLRLLVALLVAWLAPTDPLAVFVAGYLLCLAASLVVGIVRAPQPWPQLSRWRLLRRAHWLEASGYALQTASTSGVTEIDKILSARLLSPTSAGIYATASRTINALVLPVTAMMVSAMPRLFRETVRDNRRLLRWLLGCAGTYGLLAGFGVWLIAPFVQSLFGPHYDGMAELVRLLAWAVPATSLRATAANVLTTIDQTWSRVGLEVLGWVMIALLAAALAPSRHAHGLALAVVAAEWLMACTSWWAVQRYSRLKHHSRPADPLR